MPGHTKSLLDSTDVEGDRILANNSWKNVLSSFSNVTIWKIWRCMHIAVLIDLLYIYILLHIKLDNVYLDDLQ